MPAVAGGIDRKIAGAGGDGTLQYGLQRAKIIIVLCKGKIVNKQNKFQWIFSKAFDQRGNFTQLFFFDFDQPQPTRCKFICNGFYGRGFPCAAVPVQQYVCRRFAFKQCKRVVDHAFALPGISGQVRKPRFVRISDRHDAAAGNGEHMVFGKNTIAVGAYFIHAFHVYGGKVLRAVIPVR